MRSLLHRHARECGYPVEKRNRLMSLWVPAFAGKTGRRCRHETNARHPLTSHDLPLLQSYAQQWNVAPFQRIMTRTMVRAVLSCALILFAGPHAFANADELAVAEKAASLLQSRCFECHSGDRLKGGLALDVRQDALDGGDSGVAAFIPGDSGKSHLIEKILASDPDERMPAKGDALSLEEIATLTGWIDAGAPFDESADATANRSDHWAFVPPSIPEVPETKTADFHNPIDAFIEATLEEHGLAFAPETDRYSLVRRAYLELIGKPPSPKSVRSFVRDRNPGAYERLVDELLASPHYGERQARRWLDAARYADTNGYEKDRPRSIWPYRDWVIDAFNANMPFDQFTTEQIAGDLLPNATEAQRIATGFHRNAMLNEEGGIDVAEDWFKRSVDRANTTSTVFLGLTMSCAQCHTHKYDPITQREYYRFFAFFNDATEDTLRLSNAETQRRRDEIDQRVARLEAMMTWGGLRNKDAKEPFAEWVADVQKKSAPWNIETVSVESAKGATLVELDDGSILATGDIPNDDRYTVELSLNNKPVTAIRLEVLPYDSLPGGGPGRGVILSDGDFLLTGFEAEVVTETETRAVGISSATADFSADGRGPEKALDGRADTGWSINGQAGKPHAAVFAFSEAVTTPDATLRITLTQDYIHQHTIGRFRISTTSKAGPVVAAGVPAEIESRILSATSENAAITRHYFVHVAESQQDWRKLRSELIQSKPKFDTTLVMASRDIPRTSRVHHRGEFLQPRNEVQPDVPRVLHAYPETESLDRLGLARWLVSEDNPLVGRVTMNRLWQQVFGRGLVNTPEDFGLRGDLPSHPALLDWLATTFADSGWDMKAMHRLMVTSTAFRQDTAVTPALLEVDPENRLLSRGPRFRVAAEVVRDIALESSGLMNATIGGPSFYPPQPDGVTSLAYGSTKWPTSTGPDRFRRGLYVYWKRTAPYAAGSTFDAPSGETSCVARRRTNTPLQALTLMNDRVFTEAAQAMAARVLRDQSKLSKQIDHAFMLCLSRPPSKAERDRVISYHDNMIERLEANPSEATEIAGEVSEIEPQRALDLATWTLICRALLNLDEAITQG